jgi:hypothetical protein
MERVFSEKQDSIRQWPRDRPLSVTVRLAELVSPVHRGRNEQVGDAGVLVEVALEASRSRSSSLA